MLLPEQLTIGTNTIKQKQAGVLLGAPPRWGYRAIAKKMEFPLFGSGTAHEANTKRA